MFVILKNLTNETSVNTEWFLKKYSQNYFQKK